MTETHTSYLSFFLHGQNLGPNLSPQRKCLNHDKIGVTTKQRELLLNRFCSKTAQLPPMLRQNSVNHIFYSMHLKCLHIQKISHLKYLHIWDISTSKIPPHLKLLHMTQNFLHGHCPRRPRQIRSMIIIAIVIRGCSSITSARMGGS